MAVSCDAVGFFAGSRALLFFVRNQERNGNHFDDSRLTTDAACLKMTVFTYSRRVGKTHGYGGPVRRTHALAGCFCFLPKRSVFKQQARRCGP